MFRIRITNLRVPVVIGVFERERQTPQEILLNIEMDCQVDRAGRSDALTDTVDYDRLCCQVVQRLEGSSFFLLERLVQEVLDVVTGPTAVRRATVRADKLGAVSRVERVSVEASRIKDHEPGGGESGIECHPAREYPTRASDPGDSV